ncbi:MAG: N-6 DNA methylase, partial [Betaproteobacteria bacterium]|nr:N-6 DNA methylase [Betaproteobacteria bacterium]
PRCVVRLLVEMLEPYRGRVYDPCCGSAGMFVQSVEFIRAHASGNGNGGKAKGDLPAAQSTAARQAGISIYGEESNYTTWRLAKMNLAIRGIEGRIEHGDTFHNDRHPDLKADYILANGSMSSNQSGEGEIRMAIIEADLVDCMVALPGQLFYSTQIPVCLWFLTRNKRGSSPSPSMGEGRGGGAGQFRDRRGETLFIDARKMGTLVDRTHRELTDEDLAKIAGTYHAWRGDKPFPSPSTGEGEGGGEYQDIPGFCKSATLEEIRKHGHVLTPGRYVGAEAAEDDGEPFEDKMRRLAATLREQQAEAAKLDAAIAANLKGLGYGG